MDQPEAGVELDTQVAERVMGWRRSGYAYVNAEGRVQCLYGMPPAFSSDLCRAWQVVEEMWGKGFRWRIDSAPDCWCVMLWEGDAITVATTPTVPLAICRAALKAVEEQHAD